MESWPFAHLRISIIFQTCTYCTQHCLFIIVSKCTHKTGSGIWGGGIFSHSWESVPERPTGWLILGDFLRFKKWEVRFKKWV